MSVKCLTNCHDGGGQCIVLKGPGYIDEVFGVRASVEVEGPKNATISPRCSNAQRINVLPCR